MQTTSSTGKVEIAKLENTVIGFRTKSLGFYYKCMEHGRIWKDTDRLTENWDIVCKECALSSPLPAVIEIPSMYGMTDAQMTEALKTL